MHLLDMLIVEYQLLMNNSDNVRLTVVFSHNKLGNDWLSHMFTFNKYSSKKAYPFKTICICNINLQKS